MRMVIDTLAEISRMGVLAMLLWIVLGVLGVPHGLDVAYGTGLLVLPVCFAWGIVEKFEDLGED